MNENTITSATELKDHFLSIARTMVDEYVGSALGLSELKSTNSDARTETWDLLKMLMVQSSSKIVIEVGCMQDILKSVTSGKITLDEGERLIRMYKQVREAESIGVDSGDSTVLPSLTITLRDDDDKREKQGSEWREGSC